MSIIYIYIYNLQVNNDVTIHSLTDVHDVRIFTNNYINLIKKLIREPFILKNSIVRIKVHQ